MIQTKYWRLDGCNEQQVLEQAAELIQAGGTVAFPTETVYGLGANGLDQAAVEKIFLAKGRPADNPLILHIADKVQVCKLAAEVSLAAQKLIDAFWPGPLTIIFPKQPHIPDAVTAGLDTVAVRMPSHRLANKFIQICGVPLAAPSANLSGRPSPTEAQAVQADLWGRVAGIIDGGNTAVGLESTVIDCSQGLPVILRPGSVTKEQIEQIVPLREADKGDEAQTPRAPGMKYTHYAPKAPVYLLAEQLDLPMLNEMCDKLNAQGCKVGVIADKQLAEVLPEFVVKYSWSNQEQLGNGLYSWLRQLDKLGANIIFAQQVPEQGLGVAIMNRLGKAAGYKKIDGREDLEQILQALTNDL